MKNKLFLLTAVAGMFLMASCGKSGTSEEAKKKVNTFDSAWSALGSTAMAWGDSLNNMVAMCEGCCKEMDAMSCCDHLKGTKDSLSAPCKNDMKVFTDMKTAWDAEMPMWDALQVKLDSLKANVTAGKATDEQVDAALAELQAAVDKGAAEMGPWVEKFSAAKAACIKNCSDCKSGMSAASCSDKKCGHAKKS